MLNIPPKTRSELANPAPEGQRHEQMKKIACSLAGQGFCGEAIFSQLHGMYDPDVSDREIQDVISWALGKNFQPCRKYNPRGRLPSTQPQKEETAITSEKATANVEKLLGGFRCDEADLWHASAWKPLDDWRCDALPVLAALYDADDHINIVWEHL